MKINIKKIANINEASIDISGITILAAPNDAGKTTLLRLAAILHSVFKTTDNEVLSQNYTSRLIRDILKENPDLREIKNLMSNEDLRKIVISQIHPRATAELLEEIASKIFSHFQYIKAEGDLDLYLDDENENLSKFEDKNYILKSVQSLSTLLLRHSKLLSEEPIKLYLDDLLNNVFGKNVILSKNNFSLTLQDFEKELGYIGESFKGLPFTIIPNSFEINSETIFFEDVVELSRVLSNLRNPLYRNRNRNSYFVKRIIQGIDSKNISLKRPIKKMNNFTGFSLMKEELTSRYFFSNLNNNSEIEIQNTPKGVLLLNFLVKLVENNVLRENTFLIIDEPENHLHPEWQAKLALFLFELQRNYKVKILLATHSNILIETFEKIISVRDAKDVKFYFGEKNQNGNVSYIDCTEDTSRIYNSLMKGFQFIDELK